MVMRKSPSWTVYTSVEATGLGFATGAAVVLGSELGSAGTTGSDCSPPDSALVDGLASALVGLFAFGTLEQNPIQSGWGQDREDQRPKRAVHSAFLSGEDPKGFSMDQEWCPNLIHGPHRLEQAKEPPVA